MSESDMMPSQRRSPECCVFKVGVLHDDSENVLHSGSLEVTPSELVYSSEEVNTRVSWPLKYLRRYGQESESLFIIEASSRCPSGPGMYKFSTPQASQLQSIVSRNMAGLVRSPTHSESSLILTPSTPSTSSSSSSNGFIHKFPSVSPSSSPPVSRSPSIRSLPDNVYEVKNIGDDQTLVKEGTLEITSHDILYTDTVSHQRYQWPLVYLRRYGCEGNVFSIEAGRRCQGGEATYAFVTPRAAEIRDLIKTINVSDADSPSRPAVNSPPLLALSSPATQVPSSGTVSSSSVGGVSSSSPPHHQFQRSDSLLRRAHSAMELSRNIFEVRNISDEKKEVGQGKLEVTGADLIYVDSITQEKWKWPLRFLRRYGCNGAIFSFEAGRRCPGGEGLYAFSTLRASEIHEAIVSSINNRHTPENSLGSLLDLSTGRLSPPHSAHFHTSRRQSHQLRPLPAIPRQQQPAPHQPPPPPPSGTPSPDHSSEGVFTLSLPTKQTRPSKPPRSRERLLLAAAAAAKNTPHKVEHTYDVPLEVKNEFNASQEFEGDEQSKERGSPKSPRSPKKRAPRLNKAPSKTKKPPPPAKGRAAVAWLKSKRQSTSSSTGAAQSPPNNRKQKSESPPSPSSPVELTNGNHHHASSSEPINIYENTRELTESGGFDATPSPQFESVVPQPMESSSHSEQLPDNRQSRTPSIYQNLESLSPTHLQRTATESMYANVGIATPTLTPPPNVEESFIPGSYAEVEFIDGDHVTVHTPPLTPPTPIVTSGSMRFSKSEEESSVTYDTLDFKAMKAVSELQRQRGDARNFETLRERHDIRRDTTARSGRWRK